MNGLYVIVLSVIFFFLKDNVYCLFALVSLGLIFGILLIFHVLFALYLHKHIHIIRKQLSFPIITENSVIEFSFKIPAVFLMMTVNLQCRTDTISIFFKYDKINKKFYSLPFYHGYHETKKYSLEITDALAFFTFSYLLPKQTIYNFFSKHYLLEYFTSESQTLQGQKSINEDITLLFRDYMHGDDVRSIVWRIYALTEELKVKIKWKESSNPKINLFCSGLSGSNPFFTELILYKMCSIIYHFILKLESEQGSESSIIIINSSEFDIHDFEGIQKKLFNTSNEEKNDTVKHIDSKAFILYTVFSNLKPDKKQSLFISMLDFFSIDGKKYAANHSVADKLLKLLFKKSFFMKYTEYYFKYLYQKELEMEKS